MQPNPPPRTRHVSSAGAFFGVLLSIVTGIGVGVGVFFGLLVILEGLTLTEVEDHLTNWLLTASAAFGIAAAAAVLGLVAAIDGIRGALVRLNTN